jgi:methionyl-tRNA formyltransferase
LSIHKGKKISIWYLKTFGVWVFLKLSLFYILVLINNFFNKINNFKDLAKNYDIKFSYINSTNDKNLLNNINKDKKKISLLITNHILKKRIINKKNHLFINKHSYLLPSYKGLMPYLRTQIDNKYNGITFHLVNKRIDSGKIIFQKKIKKKFKSMIEFYLYIFDIFPVCFLQTLRNLNKKRFIKSKNKKSYYSIPNRVDYNNFLKKNGKVILFNDFFIINKLI